MSSEFLTVDEVAGLLRVSRWSIGRYIDAGELDAVKLGDSPNSAVRISRQSYEDLIRRNTVTAEGAR